MSNCFSAVARRVEAERAERSGASRAVARALSLLLLAPLGACGYNKVYQPPIVASDYHERHPIMLAEAQTTIDVFPQMMGARLDSESVLRIRDFIARYRRFGEGQITVLAPVGGRDSRSARLGLGEVKRVLVAGGVGHSLYIGTYPAGDPNLAAPIRLSFTGLKAKVAGRCGEWPDDLASGGSVDGWENNSFWNFGCASQAMFAAEVADPRDLVGPRGETPPDIEMRTRAITKIRGGSDPATGWSGKSSSISSVGGN
jgi:pilus assembly protein CpaD